MNANYANSDREKIDEIRVSSLINNEACISSAKEPLPRKEIQLTSVESFNTLDDNIIQKSSKIQHLDINFGVFILF